MQFLKILFWVVVAVSLTIFASQNWHDVTLNLWGDMQADIKVPFLIAAVFLLGWLPTWLIYRAKVWRQRQRLDSLERQQVVLREQQPQAQETTPVA